jgi:ribosomal protein S27AE
MPFFRTARGDATESRPGTEPGAGPVGDWDETCDRCGPSVRAAYRVHRDGDLYLCGHCTSRLRQALSAQGWTIGPVGAIAWPAA